MLALEIARRLWPAAALWFSAPHLPFRGHFGIGPIPQFTRRRRRPSVRSDDEARRPPRLSLHHRGDDRWHLLSDALHLRESGRDPEPGHRSEDPPGLDRRQPAAAGPRW